MSSTEQSYHKGGLSTTGPTDLERPPYMPTPFPPSFPTQQGQYTALTADATELRRQSAQSARDKRRHRRPLNLLSRLRLWGDVEVLRYHRVML